MCLTCLVILDANLVILGRNIADVLMYSSAGFQASPHLLEQMHFRGLLVLFVHPQVARMLFRGLPWN